MKYQLGPDAVKLNQRLEVAWYVAHGKYISRTRRDSYGRAYVVGDAAWNYRLPPSEREIIEPVMSAAIELGFEP